MQQPEEAAATDLRCIFKAAIAREEAVKGRLLNSKSQSKVKVEASFNEKAITAIIAAALTASMGIPEAAGNGVSGVSPSLKNFLLSIVAGAVVLGPILGAIIGVSNFDPVKRN